MRPARFVIRSTVALLVLVAALGAAACGDDAGGDGDGGGVDAAVDAPTDAPLPPNPFEGMFDSPDDFPRTGCRPGALAGFALTELWPDLALRTAIENGALVTYVTKLQVEEQVVPHLLTADDLLVRVSTYSTTSMRWRLRAFDVCDVLADGTLVGNSMSCSETSTGPRCSGPFDFAAAPLHRIAGEAEAGGGLSLLGEVALEGPAVNVRVANGVAFLPMLSRGMRIVSVANPAAPVKLAWWLPAEDNYYNDVKIMTVGARRYAVLAGAPSDVVDVTDPAAPFLVAQLPTGAHTVDVEGSLAYFVGSSQDLRIYDLSVPTAPVLRGELEISMSGNGTHDLTVRAGIAYVSVPYEGLATVDCTNPDAPQEVARVNQDDFRYWHSPWLTDVGGREYIVHGDEGRGGKLALIDMDQTSPTFQQEVGVWSPRPQVSLHNIMARGPRVYFAHYQDGIRVLDISNPATPTLLAYYNTWSEDRAVAAAFSSAFGLDLDPATRRIYVADSIRGLIVLGGDTAVFP